ncbi:hypothetical protein [Actinomadura sp. 6N118]|uniref:hypothetical protein n=1 Tax=Actinomadura sp. 6N118 TaxID=3375151 RepID=UPI0037874E82
MSSGVASRPSTAAQPGTAVLPPGWAVRRIPAGLWLYRGDPAGGRADEVTRIPVDADRPAIAVDAEQGSAEVLAAVAAVLDLVPGPSIRLVLPGVSGPAAQEFADLHKLDLVATSGLVETRGEHVLAWGFHEERPTTFWQWFRFRPGLPVEAMGAVHPRPVWETALLETDGLPGAFRIPAGVALCSPDATELLRTAATLHPDPERLTVVVAEDRADGVADMLAALPAEAAADPILTGPGAGRAPDAEPDLETELGLDLDEDEDEDEYEDEYGDEYEDEDGREATPARDIRLIRTSGLVPPGHVSGPAERARHRETLGERADEHLVAVARVLARRPEIVGGLPAERRRAAVTELAAVRAYVEGDLPGLDRTLRALARIDADVDGADVLAATAHAACLVAGLRVLPVVRAPVWLTSDLTPEETAVYEPGRRVLEPGFVAATVRPPLAEGPVLFALWPGNARLVSLDAGDDAYAVFAAATTFTVLAVDAPTRRNRIVHLREEEGSGSSSDGSSSDGPAGDDASVLARLRATTADPGDAPAKRCHGAPPGLDGDGALFISRDATDRR